MRKNEEIILRGEICNIVSKTEFIEIGHRYNITMKIKETVTKILAKPWRKGALFGFVFGALIAIVSALEIFAGTFLAPLPKVITSLPIYIAMKCLPDVPWFFAIIFFFVYWIALGALIGWSVTKSKVVKIIVVILIIVLLFVHLKASQAMQREIKDAVRAFIELIGVFSGIE